MGLHVDFRERSSIRWTASDFDNAAGGEFPFAQLIEYEQQFSHVLSNINYWERKVTGDYKDAYKGLYLGRETGNEYFLPYFTSEHHNIGQNWQEQQAPFGAAVQELANKVEMVTRTVYPAAGIIYPKTWTGANPQVFNIQFDLLNTIDEAGVKQNREFLETFIKQNLHVQHNVLTISPPCLYEVYIPGIRWSPVAVVSNLTVTNKGTLNRIPEVMGGNYIVPDAWEVNIQMQELLIESRNLYEQAIAGEGSPSTISVRVIESAEDEAQRFKEQLEAGKEAAIEIIGHPIDNIFAPLVGGVGDFIGNRIVPLEGP